MLKKAGERAAARCEHTSRAKGKLRCEGDGEQSLLRHTAPFYSAARCFCSMLSGRVAGPWPRRRRPGELHPSHSLRRRASLQSRGSTLHASRCSRRAPPRPPRPRRRRCRARRRTLRSRAGQQATRSSGTRSPRQCSRRKVRYKLHFRRVCWERPRTPTPSSPPRASLGEECSHALELIPLCRARSPPERCQVPQVRSRRREDAPGVRPRQRVGRLHHVPRQAAQGASAFATGPLARPQLTPEPALAVPPRVAPVPRHPAQAHRRQASLPVPQPGPPDRRPPARARRLHPHPHHHRRASLCRDPTPWSVDAELMRNRLRAAGEPAA